MSIDHARGRFTEADGCGHLRAVLLLSGVGASAVAAGVAVNRDRSLRREISARGAEIKKARADCQRLQRVAREHSQRERWWKDEAMRMEREELALERDALLRPGRSGGRPVPLVRWPPSYLTSA